MRVEFRKHDEKRRAISWQAHCSKRRRVPGPYMPSGVDIPHDLLQYVVEAATGYRYGFWGLIDGGATFKSTGRKRTKPGRAVIRAHDAELQTAEYLPALYVASWRAGERDEVTALIEAAYRQWLSLGPEDRLVFEWPSPLGAVVTPAGSPSA